MLAFVFTAQLFSELHFHGPLWIVTTEFFLVAITAEQIQKQSGQKFQFVKSLRYFCCTIAMGALILSVYSAAARGTF